MRADGWLNASKRNGACPLCDHLDWCSFTEDHQAVLCRRTELAPPGWERTKAAKDGIGFVFVVKQQNSTQQDLEQWQRERELQRQQRERSEREKRAESLSLVERDRQFHKLLNQLTLSPLDRADLKRRGLSDEEILLGGFKSVEPWQKLDFEVDHRLPGISINGRSLNIKPGDEGYLCPIKNVDGLIVGCQLRRRAQDDSGRYRWLTSATRKRPDGATSHLPNGELPLAVQRPTQLKSKAIALVEGTGVKPFITAQLRGQVVIGAASANFAGSPEQFKAALEQESAQLGTKSIILYADGGAIANPHIMRQYRTSYRLATQLGFQVLVGWWGQYTKDDPDIDELPPDTPIEHITWAEFEALAPAPRSQFATGNDVQISREQWESKFKFPQQLVEIADFVKKTYAKLTKPRGFGNQLPATEPPSDANESRSKPINPYAIVLSSDWQHWTELKLSKITYEKAKLLSKEEWQKLGCPIIEFKGGDRRTLLKELYQKWDQPVVFESSDVGQGKSHDAGKLKSDYLTGGKGRVFYNDVNHRNPSVETVERNFTDQVSRNNGLKKDETRKTASGYNHIVRPKPGEATDIAGNCPETETFLLLNQGKNLITHGGKGSPICEICPHFKNDEGKISCEFILERLQTLHSDKQIRQHLDQSVPGSAEKVEGTETTELLDVFVVEEVGASLNPYKNVLVTKRDLAHSFQELRQHNGKLASIVEPLYQAIYSLIDVKELSQYGIDYIAIKKHLPPTDQMHERIMTTYWHEWINNDPWGDAVPSVTELSKLVRKTLTPNLNNFLRAYQSPEEKQAIIKDNVPLDWISLVLDALSLNQGYLRIDSAGLHITRYNGRYRSIINTYKMVIFQDATISKDDLARRTRIKKDDIVQIQQVKPDYSNLTITLIKGMGAGSKQRRENESEFNLQNRLRKLATHIQKLNTERTGLIDHQKFYSEYNGLDVLGYWGRDNRGSNEFMGCTSLLLIGKPLPNLGQSAAEYYCETNNLTAPTGLSGRYGRWMRDKVRGETYQGIGRLRAHLRKHQQLNAYIVSNDAVTAASLLERFPGCQVKEVDVCDFCPEAASKGAQRSKGLMTVLCDALKDNPDVTTADIALQLGIVRSRVSQIVSAILKPLGIKGGFGELKRLLILFIDTLKTKLTPLEDLPGELRWIAETYLPLVAEQDPVEVVKEVLLIQSSHGNQVLRQILSATDPNTCQKLLSSLLNVLLPVQKRREAAG